MNRSNAKTNPKIHRSWTSVHAPPSSPSIATKEDATPWNHTLVGHKENLTNESEDLSHWWRNLVIVPENKMSFTLLARKHRAEGHAIRHGV